MQVKFSKYQGTGNDFVMLDNLSAEYDQLSIENIKQLCDRKFGIGSDGLIKINHSGDYAFEMDYFNADGSKSFCGNGARCAVSFAAQIGISDHEILFDAIDGAHRAKKNGNLVSLSMHKVTEVKTSQSNFIVDTGSPHFIQFVNDLSKIDVVQVGRAVRYSSAYEKEGVNVNFVQELAHDKLKVFTYERGVEDETLSCGTGVTAAAIALAYKNNTIGGQLVRVETKGGDLDVQFTEKDKTYSQISLIGSAQHVFDGKIQL